MDMKLLHDMIEDQKKELSYLVKTYGFRHQEVISVSQKLDFLISKAMNRYRLNHKIRTKKESL
ncbi:TPA: Spo0E family sporulation regulatory protein-aspartic acid phosphatase [Bacillus cereus]|uniref:aspartyl-phosphate phosphatase Spo0E family protein n=1 Tax=Bacillus cereus group TaxID=86661 RepID=UPI00103A6E9E|nr:MULTISPECIES: aspartyl-phosphate phosphatase Spo0E family protein [Bacillus cereus group]KAA0751171.1 aspartyl-phosphate phosphatase Spo0E family protein [Bacillus sp. AY1-10]MCU5696617.1 aspartyl-phosphate phosphatase Spo0E family protein [Bacillus cereus]TBX87871.1 aspartyl-phosphate phosphatase Spo0E family protein [Bacillus cereus]HDR7533204.1 aspartyl-phosphate phosphatase Spo0E family protein [Bacillus anthracis]